MNLKKIAHDKRIVACFLSILILFLVSILSLERFPIIGNFTGVFIQEANLGIKNILFSKYGQNNTANKNITIVAIDNKTLSDNGGLGRFQNFKRAYYAQVIDNLKKDGANIIGIDVLFSEKSEEDTSLEKSLKNAGNVILGFSLTEALYPIPSFKKNALGIGYFHPEINAYNSTVYSIVPEKKGNKAFSFEILQKYFDKNPEENTMSVRLQGDIYPFKGGREVPYSSSN
ncbi:MAG: CHASE2 domain-containing protein, partial [Candidatus Gracilibacteria bacterium]|nr:CHASE2 domain-containing protein [Candidatus Gracilibacteria bacterium]